MPTPETYRRFTIRVCPDKTAVMECPRALSLGDQVSILLTDVPGADSSTLMFCLFSKAVSPVALISAVTGFTAVAGTASSFFAAATISSAALVSLLEDQEPGNPVTVRAYVADSKYVWVDSDLDILPAPHLAEESWPEAESPFPHEDEVVLKAALADGIAVIKLMPATSDGEREARFVALLDLLEAAVA